MDAIVCPDGLRHEPKFSYATKLHNAIASCAADIAGNPAQLDQEQKIDGASVYT